MPQDSPDTPLHMYFLGRYQVVDEIGVGGMASVHLARVDGPGGFQKWVAIKKIHPHLAEDESFVNMFFDEARVAASISHPNVAMVFDLGKTDDAYWIAMEYLHGEPLREAMQYDEQPGQPMPPEIACRIIADAAEGLHAAHELLGPSGEKLYLVHRDVTPHNLFVTYEGVTKVVDFGIDKFSSRMASTWERTPRAKIAYMSPEQVAGEPIDRRTDIFALGVVLWELTTGQRLFRTESKLDTMAKVRECNPPRPITVVRGYPVDLQNIVMKALSKNKNERYRTAREFSRALQSLLMRRGLFVGSDEVGAFMQSLFADRFRRREEHLRWAADVTHPAVVVQIEPAVPTARWGGDIRLSGRTTPDAPSTQRGLAAAPVPRPAPGVREFSSDDEQGPDTVVTQPPDMSDLAGFVPYGKLQETGSAANSLLVMKLPPTEPVAHRSAVPPPSLSGASDGSNGSNGTVTAQPADRSIPIWVVALAATLLGVLAFVLVLFTLSRLSTLPREGHR